MALIHEELYQGKNVETLDFLAYLHRLTGELLNSYASEYENIKLKLELEPAYLDMDTAVPLGIIVNELVSNAFKHAFPENRRGKIRVSFFRSESRKNETGSENSEIGAEEGDGGRFCFKDERSLQFTLIVADNGKGILEDIDFRNTDSLGLQLVNILVEQIEGRIELIKKAGTTFKIEFTVHEG